MRALITGGAGCLGQYLIRTAPEGVEVSATWRKTSVEGVAGYQLDLGDQKAVEDLFQRVRPQLVIHTAYGSVDLENDIVAATCNLVDQCSRHGSFLVSLGSDLVLDGADGPYDESASPSPMLPYGDAKAKVEAYIADHLPEAATVRTSLIIGLDPVSQSSTWLLDKLSAKEPIELFTDELRCPIAAEDLALMLWELGLMNGPKGGVWNMVGPETLSRFAIGLLLAHRYGLDPSLIIPRRNADLSVARPRDLRMTCRRADSALRTKARAISEYLFPAADSPSVLD